MVQKSVPHATQLDIDYESTHYVHLLDALCQVESADNRLLLSTGKYVFKNLIHQAKLLQTRMTNETGSVYLSILDGEWHDLDALFRQRPSIIPFVESLFSLFYAIALGANSKKRAILCKYIDRDVCLRCLGCKGLPSQVRAKFCEILRGKQKKRLQLKELNRELVLYIKQPDHSEVMLSDFTLQYDWLDESSSYPCGGTGDLESQRPEFFDQLRRWLFVFLDDIRYQVRRVAGALYAHRRSFQKTGRTSSFFQLC